MAPVDRARVSACALVAIGHLPITPTRKLPDALVVNVCWPTGRVLVDETALGHWEATWDDLVLAGVLYCDRCPS
jgi:hypothetical protein